MKSRLLGRRFTVRTARGDLELTPSELEADLSPARLATGQWDGVTVEAQDVSWSGVRFERARATLRNVHLRRGTPSELVAAPVDLTLTLGQEDLETIVARFRPELMVEVTEDGLILLRSRRRAASAHCEVETGGAGTRIWVRPRALVLGRRRLNLPRRVPPIWIDLPLPADRLTIQDIRPGSRSLELVGRLDEARTALPTAGIEEGLRRFVNFGTLLDLTRWPWGSR